MHKLNSVLMFKALSHKFRFNYFDSYKRHKLFLRGKQIYLIDITIHYLNAVSQIHNNWTLHQQFNRVYIIQMLL